MTDFAPLIAQLDLPAKVRLLTGATSFTLAGDDSIQLQPMAYSDGPTGVRGLRFTGGEPAALLPNATLLSGAWDVDAAHEVGQAVGRNPLSIIVPCHRVVGKHGQLTGYAGGLERKRALLELEGRAGEASDYPEPRRLAQEALPLCMASGQ